ncbi:hypothetical protein [Haloprofundus halophilus]|uniref:hypothetical protein n=1 Tax=Haloprofundus halophilus TaxID=2283527 RepID=UPI00130061B7|nr:hypothetical protein [Haloprofundus halophilus]
MTRPNADVPEGVHGSMKELGKMYGISTEEAYILAAKVLLNLESEIEYNPDGDLVEAFLEKHANR